jgi:hypothetical protein
MLPTALTIARTTFLESVRQPIYFILVMLCALFQTLNTAATGYSLGYTETSEVSGDDKLLLDLGLATVLFCGTLLAGFIATAAVSREIENKTVLTVVSKPVSRSSVVFGKFLGGVGAVLIAQLTMIVFLLMAVRHGVLSTVRDPVDQPIVVFGLAAVAIALLAGAWCNFFYGWHFCQTATLVLTPLIIIAFLLALNFGKEWKVQSFTKDIKPQVLTAAATLIFAQIVLTAIAVAASTRLGQVMTIAVCFGVFVLGLLSNHLVGRHVFQNQVSGQILRVAPEIERHRSFLGSGDTYLIALRNPPARAVTPGDTIYYGPNPNGFDLASGSYPPFQGRVSDENTLFKGEGALVVTQVRPLELVIRNLGARPAQPSRPPEPDDFIFFAETKTNPLALALWGVVPNFQFFWLTDAVTQNHPVPASHLLRVAGYAGAQTVAFLALAVALFQRREVG